MLLKRLLLFTLLIVYPYQDCFSQSLDELKYAISGGVVGGALVLAGNSFLSFMKSPAKPDINTIKFCIEDNKSQFEKSETDCEKMVKKVEQIPVLSKETISQYDEIFHKKLVNDLEEQKNKYAYLVQENSKRLQLMKKDLQACKSNATEDWFIRAEQFIKEKEAQNYVQQNEINMHKFVMILSFQKNFSPFVRGYNLTQKMNKQSFFGLISQVEKGKKIDRGLIFGAYPTSQYPMVEAVDKMSRYKSCVEEELDKWSFAEHKKLLDQMGKKDDSLKDYVIAIKNCFNWIKETQNQITQLPGYESELKQHAQWQRLVEEARAKEQIELHQAETKKMIEQTEAKRLEMLQNERESDLRKRELENEKENLQAKKAESEKKKAEADAARAKDEVQIASLQANEARYVKEQAEIELKKIKIEEELQKARENYQEDVIYMKETQQRLFEKIRDLEEKLNSLQKSKKESKFYKNQGAGTTPPENASHEGPQSVGAGNYTPFKKAGAGAGSTPSDPSKNG